MHNIHTAYNIFLIIIAVEHGSYNTYHIVVVVVVTTRKFSLKASAWKIFQMYNLIRHPIVENISLNKY